MKANHQIIAILLSCYRALFMNDDQKMAYKNEECWVYRSLAFLVKLQNCGKISRFVPVLNLFFVNLVNQTASIAKPF